MLQRNRLDARRDQPDKTETTASLPDLSPGITLLETAPETTSLIHALAVDHVCCSGGTGVWIDPGSHAQTGPLVEIAPSDRILDRFRVARGFTPFQHYELLQSLPGMLTSRDALVVVPDLDRYYRGDDLLAGEGTALLLSGVAALSRAAREADVPVLVARFEDDEFSEPIATAATEKIVCEATDFGPRFRTADEETLVYPVDGGQWVQTTLAFWQEVLRARQPLYESLAQPQEVSVRGTN